jgi:hypothetical protein
VLKSRGNALSFQGAQVEKGMYQVADTDSIARCCEWVGWSENVFNETFNITNGEFMSLKDYWPLIAEGLGIEVCEDRLFSFAKEFPGMCEERDAIREEKGLTARNLEAFLGQSSHFSEFGGGESSGECECDVVYQGDAGGM